MANEEHLGILRQGAAVWNEWRKSNPNIRPDLRETDLTKADLRGTNLRKSNLYEANLGEANLSEITLREANLGLANLRMADLRGTQLNGADLFGADLFGADLSWADLSETNLRLANLHVANLSNADLRGALLIGTNFTHAMLTGCKIFGISAWNLKLDGAIQADLIITDRDESEITVDNLEVAQFIYLLLNNQKLRDVIDTITTKAVLILGRFTDERKAVLDALRDELRRRNYLPILFDFEKPANRNFTETVRTLASLSRFVIVDLSDPNSSPHEVMSFAEQFRSVPLQAIFCPTKDHLNPYPMYQDFNSLPHVLPIYRYDTQQQLIDNLREHVIDPAEAKVQSMKPK